jgi:hypothetical protein
LVTDNVGVVTGALNSGGTTDDTNLDIKITLPTNGSTAVAGDTVQLYNNTTALGTAYTLTSTDISNGYVTVPTGALSNGTTYTLNAKVIDQAGNASTATGNFLVTVEEPTPTFTTALSGITNLDVRSKIVLNIGETVTANADGTITLTDLGGTGYDGEQITHTQVIKTTDAGVEIVGTGASTKIIIDPTWDLDLSSNYKLDISAGAFKGATKNSAAFSTTFSTVNVGTSLSNAVQAQEMDTSTGAMKNSLKWFDVSNTGNPVNGPEGAARLDFNTGDYAAVIRYVREMYGSPTLDSDTNVWFKNFGTNDLLYVDDQRNDAAQNSQATINADVFSGGVGSTSDPFILAVEGTGTLGSVSMYFEVDPNVTLPDNLASNMLLQEVIRNGWSNTGMIIAA